MGFPRSSVRAGRRWRAIAAGGLVVVALSACTGRPGAAAVVDGQTISTTELSTAAAELAPYLSEPSLANVLTILVQAPATLEVAEDAGYGASTDDAKALLTQVVTASDADAEVPDFSAGALTIAQASVALTNIANADDAADIQAKILTRLGEQDIEVNPRFGTLDTATGSVVAATTPSWIVAPAATS